MKDQTNTFQNRGEGIIIKTKLNPGKPKTPLSRRHTTTMLNIIGEERDSDDDNFTNAMKKAVHSGEAPLTAMPQFGSKPALGSHSPLRLQKSQSHSFTDFDIGILRRTNTLGRQKNSS